MSFSPVATRAVWFGSKIGYLSHLDRNIGILFRERYVEEVSGVNGFDSFERRDRPYLIRSCKMVGFVKR